MPAKVKDMQGHVDKLLKGKGMVDIKQEQRLAGQLSWASGLFPWFKCFNTSSTTKSGPRRNDLVNSSSL